MIATFTTLAWDAASELVAQTATAADTPTRSAALVFQLRSVSLLICDALLTLDSRLFSILDLRFWRVATQLARCVLPSFTGQGPATPAPASSATGRAVPTRTHAPRSLAGRRGRRRRSRGR